MRIAYAIWMGLDDPNHCQIYFWHGMRAVDWNTLLDFAAPHSLTKGIFIPLTSLTKHLRCKQQKKPTVPPPASLETKKLNLSLWPRGRTIAAGQMLHQKPENIETTEWTLVCSRGDNETIGELRHFSASLEISFLHFHNPEKTTTGYHTLVSTRCLHKIQTRIQTRNECAHSQPFIHCFQKTMNGFLTGVCGVITWGSLCLTCAEPKILRSWIWVLKWVNNSYCKCSSQTKQLLGAWTNFYMRSQTQKIDRWQTKTKNDVAVKWIPATNHREKRRWETKKVKVQIIAFIFGFFLDSWGKLPGSCQIATEGSQQDTLWHK